MLEATVCLSAHAWDQTNKEWIHSVEGKGGVGRAANLFEPSSARPLPSGVTACGVLWVRPGDPMTRRPSSIVLI